MRQAPLSAHQEVRCLRRCRVKQRAANLQGKGWLAAFDGDGNSKRCTSPLRSRPANIPGERLIIRYVCMPNLVPDGLFFSYQAFSDAECYCRIKDLLLGSALPKSYPISVFILIAVG